MTLKHLFFNSVLLTGLFLTQACSESNAPDEPQKPEEIKNDTITVKLVSDLIVTEESLISRAGNSNDLIGVEIWRKTSANEWIAPTSIIYASGVFDDINDIAFKFVKGGTYKIRMTYFPDAKNIVYKYSDGTYGAPFSYLYGLKNYKLNEPVYYTGTEGGWSGGGDKGPVLEYLLEDIYQPTDDRTVQTFKRGKTPRYSGETEEITITDNTNINIKLELCLMAITLNPENFTEGKLSLVFRNNGYMENDNSTWSVTPQDDKTLKFQIPYSDGEESLELFYTNGAGEKYLLATKQLQHKHNANYIFSFSLTERADGSIGIQMPSEDSMVNEDATFDF
ncbi:MAG: hypothetical protein HDR74_07715 [Bacteroides sp.]|nr:hypothetical protein [Bacteroides sp.]